MVSSVGRFIKTFEKNDIKILEEMGFQVDIATNTVLNDNDSLNELHNLVNNIEFPRRPFSLKTISATSKLLKLLKRNDYYAIHVHTPVAAFITRLVVLLYKKKKMKIIYTCHGFHFNRNSSLLNWMLYYPIEYLMSFVTDLIITINQEDYEIAKKFKAKNVELIAGVGIDLNRINSNQVNGDELRNALGYVNDFIIITIGELSKRKNQKVIFEALSLLNSKNIRYILIGSGSEYLNLKKLATKLNISDQIVFCGELQKDDVYKLINIADIGAIPSKIEGLGLAGLECLACGKPLIGSGYQGISEYLKDGLTGFICKNNPETYAYRIKELVENKTLIQTMKPNCIQMATKFDISQSDKQMRKIYNSILGDTGCCVKL